jgi:hypothetical protein
MSNPATAPGYLLTRVVEPGTTRARAVVTVLADLSEVPAPDIEPVSLTIDVPDERGRFRTVYSAEGPLSVVRASVAAWRDLDPGDEIR